jgi:hypothetical protein
MRKLLLLLLVCRTAAAQDREAPDPSAVNNYVIPSFPTERGVVLPVVHIVYGIYGRLNAARDNAVLLRCREGIAVDPGTVPVYSFGDRSLFSDRRCGI